MPLQHDNAGMLASAGSAPSANGSAGLEDSGVQALGTTPSVINLAGLEAEARMLDELRHRTRAHSDQTSHAGGGGVVAGADGEQHTPRSGTEGPPPLPPLFAVAAPLVRMGMMNVVDDSFTRCFKSQKRVPWNWNLYLWPAWALGLVFRYVLLFPCRLLALMLGFLTIFTLMPVAKLLSYFMDTKKMETAIIQLFASSFVASWSGIVRIHGLRPTPRPGKPAGVFVANHSSMIDFIILLQSHPYAGEWMGPLYGCMQRNIGPVEL